MARQPVRPAVSDLAFGAWDWLARNAEMTAGSKRAARFGSFGEGTRVRFPQQELYNEQAIHLGRNTLIGPWTSLTVGMVPGQQLVADRMLVIGDNCVIGRFCSIAAHLEIVIGDGVFFGPNVFVTDQNHDNARTDIPIGNQYRLETPVSIGAHSWLGTGVVVTPGVTIGERVMIGANSVVTADIPDDAVAVGAPARVIG